MTDLSAVMTTVQVREVPVQAPVQPVQAEPGSGVAVSVTLVLGAKLVPGRLLVTVPLPLRATVSL